MKVKLQKNWFQLFTVAALCIALASCGQNQSNRSQFSTNNNQLNNMDVSKITNESVKKAIEALQANDKNCWNSYFVNDAIFTDDGRTLDFKSFFDNAFNKKENFYL